jgi:hypothetical protein
VSGMVLQIIGRGLVWFFRQLRLGLPDVDSHKLRYESSLVVQRLSSVISDNIEDKI